MHETNVMLKNGMLFDSLCQYKFDINT